jgi:HAD superfamily hydrolase (TIGR01509 family)
VVSALVFDFDGLILDTESSAFSTAADVFAAHGMELSRDWWNSIIGTADHPHWSEVLEEMLGAPIPDRERVVEERIARHHALIAEEPVRPGVVALLDEAAASRVPTAIASSSPLAWVDGHLERLGLRGRFAAVCTRDMVSRAKPAPDLYLAACAAVAADPRQAVAFEDSPNGIAAATAAGLRCIGVPGPMTAALDLTAADVVVGSLADVRWDDLIALTSSL